MLATLPPQAFHWYRRSPGSSQWLLIDGVSGPSYRLGAADVGSQVMVVVALPSANGSQRQASAPVGPISTAP